MTARKFTILAAMLNITFLAGESSAVAQDEVTVAQSQEINCRRINGDAADTWPGAGNMSTGVVTGAGVLSGTTEYVYDTDPFSTPDPDTVTFGAELTLSANVGVLSARVLFLFNFVNGIWTSIATIDPNRSTGRFAGASGTLWFPRGTTVNLEDGGQAYPSRVTGVVCLVPRHGHNRDDPQPPPR